MKTISKIQLIILLAILAGGIICWFFLQRKEIAQEKEVQPKEMEEIFNLTAKVSKIDLENNFLMVKPTEEAKEIKVFLSQETKLVKLDLPPNDVLPEETFALKEAEITLKDFKEGDEVFIKANENIVGKEELDNIESIHVLP